MAALRSALTLSGEASNKESKISSKSLSDSAILRALVAEAEKDFVSGYVENHALIQFLEHYEFLKKPFNKSFTDVASCFDQYIQFKDEVITREKSKSIDTFIFSDYASVREVFSKEQVPDDMIFSQRKWPVTIKPGPVVETVAIKKESIQAAANFVATNFSALHDAAGILQVELKNVDPDEKNILDLVSRVKKLKLPLKYHQYAEKHGIPIEVMQEVVFPYAVHFQATKLYDFMNYYLRRFPRLDNLYNGSEKPTIRREKNGLIQFCDERFPTYSANQIGDTSFVAASGPRDEKDVEKLIDNTVFNKVNPVSEIVAVGNIFKKDNSSHYDFINYFLFPENETQKFGKYELTVVDASDDYLKLIPELKSNNQNEFPVRSARIVLNVKEAGSAEKPKKLIVNFFKAIDNTPLDLQNEDDFSRLFEIYKLMQKNQKKILVHCQAGAGRTGHFILGMLLAKNIKNSNLTAKDVLQLVDEIRKDRPAAILTIDQFRIAVQTAMQINFRRNSSELRNTISLIGSAGSKSELKKAESATTVSKTVTTEPVHPAAEMRINGSQVNLNLNFFGTPEKPLSRHSVTAPANTIG